MPAQRGTSRIRRRRYFVALRVVVTLLTISTAGLFRTTPQLRADDVTEPARLLSGHAFDEALDRAISIAWQDQELRTGLSRLGDARRVAILLDRRIDPGQTLTLRLQNIPLREVLNVVATECGCGISVLESVVYVGPAATAFRLRTLIELQSQELVAAEGDAARRAFELLARHPFNWDDLTSPQELLTRTAGQYGLKLVGGDAIPHDLWAGSTPGNLTASEALMIVLSQFDLSFEWISSSPQQRFDGLRIVAMPSSVLAERRFTLKQSPDTDLSAQLERAIAGVRVNVRGRTVTANGTVEQLADVELLLFPDRAVARSPATRKTGPATTTYTFRVKATRQAFMTALEQQSGFTFDYDAGQLRSAGVTLDTIIEINMKDATASELFDALFQNSNAEWKLDGKLVRVIPASRLKTPEK